MAWAGEERKRGRGCWGGKGGIPSPYGAGVRGEAEERGSKGDQGVKGKSQDSREGGDHLDRG